MFHFQRPVTDWPRAARLLPAGYVIKCIDNVQMLAEVKAHNPGLKTILRHHYTDHQTPSDTDEGNEYLARIFFDSFIDGTFLYGETADINHAAATDFVEGWNEYYAASQSDEDRARFVSWDRASIKVWNTEYRTRPGLEHIRLIAANVAIGNDIPIEVARAVQEYSDGTVLGYHPYWPVRDNQVPADEWRWYSGRWAEMDKHYRANGVTVEWAFTEAGAVGYHGEWPSIGLNPNDGWRLSSVHGANTNEYLVTIDRWMTNWAGWNKTHGNRAMAPVLFNSGSWPGAWESYEIAQPEMDQIASFVRNWQPEDPEPPTEPPPPEPPPPPGGVPYIVVVNLLPQDAMFDEKLTVLDAAHENKETILQSADDAARLVEPGRVGSKVKVWEPDRWTDDIVEWLHRHGVTLVEVKHFD